MVWRLGSKRQYTTSPNRREGTEQPGYKGGHGFSKLVKRLDPSGMDHKSMPSRTLFIESSKRGWLLRSTTSRLKCLKLKKVRGTPLWFVLKINLRVGLDDTSLFLNRWSYSLQGIEATRWDALRGVETKSADALRRVETSAAILLMVPVKQPPLLDVGG
jgi:hypothetical protein